MAKPAHIIEYALFRAIGGFLMLLPYPAALAVGWCVAWLGHYVVAYRRTQARARIAAVFAGRLSPAEVKRIAWRSWRNLIFVGVELLRLPRLTRRWAASAVDGQAAVAVCLENARAGRGGIIATPHMGSWEIAAAVFKLNGVPIFSFFAEQKNPLTSAHIDRMRTSLGAGTVARGPGAIRTVLRKLREGGILAILPDLRSPTEGFEAPFLGGHANVGLGMASFARHTEAPILPMIFLREGWTRHVIRVGTPIARDMSLDKKTDMERMTRQVFAVFDKAIREHPDQWFWYNKRWILDPLDRQQPA